MPQCHDDALPILKKKFDGCISKLWMLKDLFLMFVIYAQISYATIYSGTHKQTNVHTQTLTYTQIRAHVSTLRASGVTDC